MCSSEEEYQSRSKQDTEERVGWKEETLKVPYYAPAPIDYILERRNAKKAAAAKAFESDDSLDDGRIERVVAETEVVKDSFESLEEYEEEESAGEASQEIRQDTPRGILDRKWRAVRDSNFKIRYRRKKGAQRKYDIQQSRIVKDWKEARQNGDHAWRRDPGDQAFGGDDGTFEDEEAVETDSLVREERSLSSESSSASEESVSDAIRDILDEDEEEERYSRYSAILTRMIEEKKDYMAYIDDRAFVRYFDSSYAELLEYAHLNKALEDEDTMEGVRNYYGKRRFPGPYKLADMFWKYKNILDFYRAKMDLISNHFYSVFFQSDLEDLTLEELHDNWQQNITAGGKNAAERAAYFDALYRLKKLKEEQGEHYDVQHKFQGEGQDTEKIGSGEYKIARSLFRRDYEGGMNKNLKMHFAFLTGSAGAGVYKSLKTSSSTEGDLKLKEGFGAKLGAEGNLQGRLMEGSITVKDKVKVPVVGLELDAEREAEIVVGEVKATGSIALSLSENPSLGAEVSVKAVGARGRIGASLSKETAYGKFGAGYDANAEVGVASASATAKFGSFKFHNTATGKDEELNGFATILSAQAAAVNVTGRGHITICGIKLSASTSLQAGGVGGTVGVYAGAQKIGLSLGALLGLGAKLDIEVDFSGLIDHLRKKIN